MLIGTLIFTALLFHFSFLYDNKYTIPSPPTQDGVILVSADMLHSGRLVPIIDGWRCYPGLLSPDQIIKNQGHPLFIGQYPDFEKILGTPYGEVTYQINIRQQGAPIPLQLELQEVFSASRVFVNGAVVLTNGIPEKKSYLPYIQNQIINIPAVSDIELIIQVSNYSHYYSGIFYPPILATPKVLGKTLAVRAAFYSILSFFTLGIATLSVAFWFFSPRTNLRGLLLGLIALFFACHTAYPFVHYIGGSNPIWTYVLEDVAFFLVMLCTVLLTQFILGNTSSKFHQWVVFLSLFLVTASFIFPTSVLPYIPELHTMYGYLIDGGKVFIAAYLILFACKQVLLNDSGTLFLCGNSIYGFGLIFDVFTSGNIEPIRFGWPTELCGFILVLLFAAEMIRNNYQVQQENLKLTQHLEEVVTERTAQLQALEQERKRFFADMAHDLKAPVSAVRMYIDLIREGNIQVDDELQGYLSVLDDKSVEMQQRVQNMQQFTAFEASSIQLDVIEVIHFIKEIHNIYLPDTDAAGIYFHVAFPPSPCFFKANHNRMIRALENIIINAIDFTPMNGSITLRGQISDQHIILSLSDTGTGISEELLPHIFEYGYSTRNANLSRGLGLYFTKTVAVESGGSISVRSTVGAGTTIELSFPLYEERAHMHK